GANPGDPCSHWPIACPSVEPRSSLNLAVFSSSKWRITTIVLRTSPRPTRSTSSTYGTTFYPLALFSARHILQHISSYVLNTRNGANRENRKKKWRIEWVGWIAYIIWEDATVGMMSFASAFYRIRADGRFRSAISGGLDVATRRATDSAALRNARRATAF